MVLGALLIFSTERMLTNAFRRAYDGPMDAVVGIFAVAIEYGSVLIKPEVIAVLVLGGVLAGLLSDWAARNWR